MPTHDLIAWWRDWLARHAHLVTPSEGIDDKDRAAAVTPTMLAWLTADGSRPESVDPARLAPLLPDSHLRVRWGLTPPDTALVRVLTGHTGPVGAVAWPPDGTRLASAGPGGEVRVWDPATGEQLATLTGHTRSVDAMAWSADGTRLASAGYDDKINIFELGRPDHTIYLRVEPLTCLQWSNAGIAIGGPHGVGVLELAYT